MPVDRPLRLLASGLVIITVVSLFVIFHVVKCSFEYVPTIIFLPTDKLFNFQPGIPTHASKHVDVYQFLFHSKLFVRPYLPLLHNQACTTYNCTSSYPLTFFSAPIFHRNILHWWLLFPWYRPFKFTHAHPHQIFYTDFYCSLGTDHSNSSMLTRAEISMSVSSVPLVNWQRLCLLFLLYHTEHSSMHFTWCTTNVTTKVTSRQHHNKNQLQLSYYPQHRHVVKEPY